MCDRGDFMKYLTNESYSKELEKIKKENRQKELKYKLKARTLIRLI